MQLNNFISYLRKTLILLSLVLSISYTSYAKEKLVIVADYWCPYNCIPGSEKEGYLVEIARLALNSEDIEIEYQLRPWEESVNDFNNGEVDGVFGASNEDGLSDPVLPSIEQASGRISAYTRKDIEWIYDGPNSLRGKNIGVIEAYAYPTDVKNFLYTTYLMNPQLFHFFKSENAIKENISSLLSGGIFTYIEDENVINNYVNSENITNIRHAGVVKLAPEKIYIAFSKTNPRSNIYAKNITNAMLEFKTNGILDKLMKKYNIKNYVNVAILLR